MAYEWGFVRGGTVPESNLYLANSGLGFLVSNGTYITVQASTQQLLLDTAKALRPIPATS
jgi:hypothetical protein